ncbi:MAG: hypothetical protein ABSG13_09305 [Bryobacteraceae bacterium]|jgi:hypothetical protein
MARFEIVDAATELQSISVAVFKTDDDEVALAKLRELNGDGPAKYAMVDTWHGRAIVA